eukprot:740531-Pelagomonas_calceolata.AAC.3
MPYPQRPHLCPVALEACLGHFSEAVFAPEHCITQTPWLVPAGTGYINATHGQATACSLLGSVFQQ